MIKFNLQTLEAAISRLSKREKQGLAVAIFFVAMILLDRGVIAPIASKITSSLDAEIQEEKANIKKGLRLVAQERTIYVSKPKSTIPYVASSKSQEEEMTFVLKELEKLASKNSVYLVDMKPGGSEKPR